MKRIFSLLAATLLALCAWAQSLTLSADKLEFGSNEMRNQQVQVTSPESDWSATSNEEWCRIHKVHNTLKVICNQNNTGRDRKAVVTVRNAQGTARLNVTQLSAGGKKQKAESKQPAKTQPAEIVIGDDGIIEVDLWKKGPDSVEIPGEWEVLDAPSWTDVEIDFDKVTISVEKTKKDRTGRIVMKGKDGYVNVILYQRDNVKRADADKVRRPGEKRDATEEEGGGFFRQFGRGVNKMIDNIKK